MMKIQATNRYKYKVGIPQIKEERLKIESTGYSNSTQNIALKKTNFSFINRSLISTNLPDYIRPA
ncbi:hypothetical protein PBAC_02440 [Pedobacter glucosidilyticus]|nr:hypothetical protein PBAC_02440 [Pedobacter glucosidilyticus]